MSHYQISRTGVHSERVSSWMTVGSCHSESGGLRIADNLEKMTTDDT